MNIILDEKSKSDLQNMLSDSGNKNAAIVIYRALDDEAKKDFFKTLASRETYQYKNNLCFLLLEADFADLWKDVELLEEKDFKNIFNSHVVKYLLNKSSYRELEIWKLVYKFCSKHLTEKALKKWLASEVFEIFFNRYSGGYAVLDGVLKDEIKRLKIDMEEEFLNLCKHWEQNQQQQIMSFLLSDKAEEFKKVFKLPKSTNLIKIWLTCLNEDGVESQSRYEDLMINASYNASLNKFVDFKRVAKTICNNQSLKLLYSFSQNKEAFKKIFKEIPEKDFYKLVHHQRGFYFSDISDILNKCSKDLYSMIFKKYLKGEKLCK